MPGNEILASTLIGMIGGVGGLVGGIGYAIMARVSMYQVRYKAIFTGLAQIARHGTEFSLITPPGFSLIIPISLICRIIPIKSLNLTLDVPRRRARPRSSTARSSCARPPRCERVALPSGQSSTLACAEYVFDHRLSWSECLYYKRVLDIERGARGWGR
jgi:hypothetical protein